MPYESSRAYATSTWKASHLVHDNLRRVNGVYARQHDEFGKKERVVYYLSKKFTTCEMNYSLLEKNVLCFSMGIPSPKAVHAEPYHLVDIQNGPG